MPDVASTDALEAGEIVARLDRGSRRTLLRRRGFPKRRSAIREWRTRRP